MDEGRGSLGEVILRCSDSKLGESDRTGVCTGELSCEDWSGDAGVSTRFVDSEPKSLPRTPIFFFLFSIIKRRMEYYKGCWRVVTATRFLYLLFYSRFLIRKITMTGFIRCDDLHCHCQAMISQEKNVDAKPEGALKDLGVGCRRQMCLLLGVLR